MLLQHPPSPNSDCGAQHVKSSQALPEDGLFKLNCAVAGHDGVAFAS